MHCFDSVMALMFVVGASEYDRYDEKNCLKESLELWSSICNGRWFSHASMILLLNKIDVLREKIKVTPFRGHFPSYSGDEEDFDQVSTFIAGLFVEHSGSDRNVICHLTNARDMASIDLIFSTIRDLLFESLNIF